MPMFTCTSPPSAGQNQPARLATVIRVSLGLAVDGTLLLHSVSAELRQLAPQTERVDSKKVDRAGIEPASPALAGHPLPLLATSGRGSQYPQRAGFPLRKPSTYHLC